MCSEEVVENIKYLASLSVNKEICGVVLQDGTTLPITNISTKPNCFIFSKKEWYSLLNNNKKILCIYHSHINNDPTPSKEDLVCQDNIKYDFLIVAGNNWSYTKYA